MMKYKNMTATLRGGPKEPQILENKLREAAAGEARFPVLAIGVSETPSTR